MFDERFQTPRCTALSSRSNCSSLYTARSQGSDNDGASSGNERWHTPRYSVSSARSAASFATARTSPMETVQVHRHHNGEGYSFASDRDRSRDFRRFADHPYSHRRPATATIELNGTYQRNYDLAETGGVSEARSKRARVNDTMESLRCQRNQDMFSLARHGRAVSLLVLTGPNVIISLLLST